MRLFATALLLTSSPNAAIGQQAFHLGGEPSKRAQVAMPLARCIWKQRYAEALAFTNELERGLSAKLAVQRLAALQQSCSKITVGGDIIAAIVHSRQTSVADCLVQKAPGPYRKFRRNTRKETAAARHFVEKGFPNDLKAAAVECDVTLTYDFAGSERTDFGNRVLGW